MKKVFYIALVVAMAFGSTSLFARHKAFSSGATTYTNGVASCNPWAPGDGC